MSELVLYTSDDGRTRLDLRVGGQTVWLTQLEIAELFQTTKQNVSLHAKNIFEDGELSPEATVKESLTVQTEGKREVQRTIQLYNLDLILAIGYRVRSPRGVQFRQWASSHLKEYIVKGFVMDDERLKNPGGWDYFDELLARIRDIRASEKRFYQKVRDLFALSSDYKSRKGNRALLCRGAEQAPLRRHPANRRRDHRRPRRSDQAQHGAHHLERSRVRKQDIIIAKNYLNEDEVDTLNRLVVIFLEQAELRAKQQQDLTLDFWRTSVDRMLSSTDQPLLDGPGSVSHEAMKTIAADRYTGLRRQATETGSHRCGRRGFESHRGPGKRSEAEGRKGVILANTQQTKRNWAKSFLSAWAVDRVGDSAFDIQQGKQVSKKNRDGEHQRNPFLRTKNVF